MPFVRINVRIPDRIVNVEGVRNEIIRVQNQSTAPNLKSLFRKTTEGWKSPPYFAARRIDTASQLGVFVHPEGPNQDKYELVNEGARPHEIRPRRARMLRFQTGYLAGTRPRIIGSQAYSRFGDFVRTGLVHHPGFEAREFDWAIAQEYGPHFDEEMQRAIARGAH